MTIYWLMLLVPLLAGISPWKAKGALPKLQWILYGVILVIIIGLRHEVGGDWFPYIENFSGLGDGNLSQVITVGSPSRDFGFDILYWFSLKYLNGIYFTNFICAFIFIIGLFRLCNNMPIPWLALVVSIPYFIIVVAMGYTRQASAIGFIMWGLIDLMNGKQVKFYVMVILGTLFHKTALIMLPIGFLYFNSVTNFKNAIIFIILFTLAFFAFLAEKFSFLVYNYITNKMLESSGAFIRVGMNVVASIVFLYYNKQWRQYYKDSKLWLIFSAISLIMLPLTFASSTIIDRFALFLLPMQLVIFSRVPVFITNTYSRTLFILFVLFIYFGVMFVWLNFGTNSRCWLPYQNILFK